MLKSSFTLRRQFSTSSTLWNVQRPIVDHLPKPQDALSEVDVPEPSQPLSEEILKARTPLHIPTDAKAPEISVSKATATDSREPLSTYDLEVVKKRIREWSEQAAIALRNRADDFTAHTKTTFSQLGSELNRVTGYEEIEALKRAVVEQGKEVTLYI